MSARTAPAAAPQAFQGRAHQRTAAVAFVDRIGRRLNLCPGWADAVRASDRFSVAPPVAHRIQSRSG
jgi:hypothetical protein